MAETRMRFAQRLNEMSEELGTLVKEVDKNRKQVRQFDVKIPDNNQFSTHRPRTLRPDMNGLSKNPNLLQKNAKIASISLRKS
jgi:hypothetical protein